MDPDLSIIRYMPSGTCSALFTVAAHAELPPIPPLDEPGMNPPPSPPLPLFPFPPLPLLLDWPAPAPELLFPAAEQAPTAVPRATVIATAPPKLEKKYLPRIARASTYHRNNQTHVPSSLDDCIGAEIVRFSIRSK